MSAVKSFQLLTLGKFNQHRPDGFYKQAAWRGRVLLEDSAFQFAVLAVWIFMRVVSAGAQSTDAVILGTITDAQGALEPGVTVTVRNPETGLTRTSLTGDDGKYRVAPLPPGTYDLKAERQGFAAVEIQDLVLTIGLEVPQNLTLKLSSVEQTVTVRSEAPVVEIASSEVASEVVERQQIDSLPITQRQVAMLALLEPGTTPDVGRVSRPLASIGAGAVNAAGSNYLLDGLSNVISGNGDPRDLVQEAVVQEFKVILGQAPAEYGGRAAGVVTVASKGGTNQLHGEAFEYFRDHYINRVDTITQAQYNSNPTAFPIQPFSRNQYGVEIGGPIQNDRLYFLFSFEELNDQEYFTVSPGGGKSPAVTAAFAPLEGSFRGGALFREYFGRLDYQFSPKNSAFLRFSEQNPATNYAQNANGGDAAAFSGSGDSSVRSWTYALVDSWLISDKTVNQFAAQVAQSWQLSTAPHFNTPAQYANGSIQINFPDLTWGFYQSTEFHPFYQEVRDDVTRTASQHTFRFGVDELRTPRKLDAPATPLGVWTFAKDYQPTAASPTFDPQNPNFNWTTVASATPIKFTTNFPQLNWQDENLMQGFYFEDEWKVRPNLTLNLGVRYDLQTGVWRNHLSASLYPVPLPYVKFGGHGDYDNLAPRMGFAWDPLKDGRTVVRGGFGIVNVNLQDNAFEGEITTLRQTQITITGTTANPIPWPDPYNGLTYQQYLAAHPQSALNTSTNANNVYNPQVFTYNLGVARQFKSDFALSVEGLFTHMKGLVVSENVNTPNPLTGLRPLPAYGQINESAPIGNYNYSGLFVRLDKRFSKRYQYVVSYTLAKQTDNYNSTTAITDFYHPSLDDGLAVTDRRHNLVVSGSVLLRYRITVGAIWTLRSSLPFSALAGGDLNNDGAITDYVPGTGKNSRDIGQTLAIVNAWRATKGLAPIPRSQIESNRYNQLDARVSKDIDLGERFKLQVIGQLFNVLGTNNYGGVGTTQQANASTGSATAGGTFGTFTAALPLQQGELAVRVVF